MFVRSLSKRTRLAHRVLSPMFVSRKALSYKMNRAHPPHLTLNASGQKYKLLVKQIKGMSWRMLASSSALPPEAPKPPGDTPPPPNKISHIQKVNPLSSQLANADHKIEKAITKVPERQLDISSKKFGWLVSGTVIGLMSAFFGKLYMLFGAVPLVVYHSKDMDVMSKTFNRDSTFLYRYSKCWLLAKRIKNGNLTLPKVFQQMEKKHPDKIMLQMHDQNWKYKDVASYANRTSRLMQKYGFQKGDVVAMFALNSPEMVAIVLGMANIGIITTLISTELRNKGLTQAIRSSGCKGIIFDDELMHAFGDVYNNFEGVKIFQMRHKAKKPEFRVLEEELLKEYNDLPEVFVNVHHDDPLLYMYAPDDNVYREPMVITHEKFLFDSSATAMMLDLNSSEKIYNPTPLHESTGMILGIGPSITNGVTTVLRSKFSATDYFRECYVYNCTVGQYTGSMCKHLLLSPMSPIETFHPVRVMYGTGLESDYWQEFVNRFGTKMYEVHDASRDNINLINLEGKIGVVGFRPKLAPSFLFPHYVIKVFGKDNIPVRNEDGFCQLSDYGEPGMLIKLWNGSANLPPKVKTIQNIFKNGDMAITSGEILTIDENLYLRPLKKHLDKSWMNKLVTSEEVEYIASKFTSKRCAAYSFPMSYKQDIEILAIEDPKSTLDMKKFTDDLVDHLPKNWIPHYVRIVTKFELLPTKKVDKTRLIQQGLNMEGDLVHYFDKNSMCYKPLIWAKGERPQMIVNESNIQPLVETVVKARIISGASTKTKVPKKVVDVAPKTTVTGKIAEITLKSEVIAKKTEALKKTDIRDKITELMLGTAEWSNKTDVNKMADTPKTSTKVTPTPVKTTTAENKVLNKTAEISNKTKVDEMFAKVTPTPVKTTATATTTTATTTKMADTAKTATTEITAKVTPTTVKTKGESTVLGKTAAISNKTIVGEMFAKVTPTPAKTTATATTTTTTTDKKTDEIKTHTTAQIVKEKKPRVHYIKPTDTMKNILKAIETATKVEPPKIISKPDMTKKVDKTASQEPATPAIKTPKINPPLKTSTSDFSDMISRKFKDFAEPVMTMLMKERLAQKSVTKVPPIRSKEPKEDEVKKVTSTPSMNIPKVLERPLQANKASSEENKTAMLIKSVMQDKSDAPVVAKSNENKKVANKSETVLAPKSQTLETSQTKDLSKSKSDTSFGFASSPSDTTKPSNPTGAPSSGSNQRQETKPDSTKKD